MSSESAVVLALARRYSGTIIGSVFFGKKSPSDIDILLAVPGPQLGTVEQALVEAGFKRNETIDPETCDENIIASYRLGTWDVQLATPAVWVARRAAQREIKRRGLHNSPKPQIYAMYRQFYKGGL